VDSSSSRTASTAHDAKRLDAYKEALNRLFPSLPRQHVDVWSIADVDVMALGLFLECYAREVNVIDIGAFVGVSAFFFAGRPEVSKVHSIDPNPPIVHEINDKSEMLGIRIDHESLGKLRVLDIARAALVGFPDERKKVQFHEGVLGSVQTAVEEGSHEVPRKLDAAAIETTEGAEVLAFVDGLHTREGVRSDLEAVFGNYPRALVVLDDCRGAWAPFVQAGVADFMERSAQKYHFKLLADLGPGIVTSALGIVYSDVDAPEMQQTLIEYGALFSERLDPLWLLRREEELIGIVNFYRDFYRDTVHRLTKDRQALAELRERERDHEAELRARERDHETELRVLRQRNSELATLLSKRRYKLVDAVAEMIPRVPGIGKVAQRKPKR
jgi:hypothetical protein